MLLAPHYVRDYRRMVRNFLRTMPHDVAVTHAVGGDFNTVGPLQLEVLRDAGLRDDDYVIDVGCGSGRTALALSKLGGLRYLGTDVVPELVAHAQRTVGRPDWSFAVVDGLSIPEADNQADIVLMFSVLTHLRPKEGQRYVADAARVIKPGGRIIASFLDASLAEHRRAAGGRIEQIRKRILGWDVKNQLLSQADIATWARILGLSVRFFGPETIGQSYAVLKK